MCDDCLRKTAQLDQLQAHVTEMQLRVNAYYEQLEETILDLKDAREALSSSHSDR